MQAKQIMFLGAIMYKNRTDLSKRIFDEQNNFVAMRKLGGRKIFWCS